MFFLSLVKNIGFGFPTADLLRGVDLELSRVLYAVGLIAMLAGQFIIKGKWLYTVLTLAFQFAVVVIILWKREWFLERIQ